MKETLRKSIQRLASENLALREKLSVLATDNHTLRTKLAERDHLARKLISRHNHGTSPRRLAMEAARKEAMSTGKAVKAVDHV
jgi:hypothetical protein